MTTTYEVRTENADGYILCDLYVGPDYAAAQAAVERGERARADFAATRIARVRLLTFTENGA